MAVALLSFNNHRAARHDAWTAVYRRTRFRPNSTTARSVSLVGLSIPVSINKEPTLPRNWLPAMTLKPRKRNTPQTTAKGTSAKHRREAEGRQH